MDEFVLFGLFLHEAEKSAAGRLLLRFVVLVFVVPVFFVFFFVVLFFGFFVLIVDSGNDFVVFLKEFLFLVFVVFENYGSRGRFGFLLRFVFVVLFFLFVFFVLFNDYRRGFFTAFAKPTADSGLGRGFFFLLVDFDFFFVVIFLDEVRRRENRFFFFFGGGFLRALSDGHKHQRVADLFILRLGEGFFLIDVFVFDFLFLKNVDGGFGFFLLRL